MFSGLLRHFRVAEVWLAMTCFILLRTVLMTYYVTITTAENTRDGGISTIPDIGQGIKKRGVSVHPHRHLAVHEVRLTRVHRQSTL